MQDKIENLQTERAENKKRKIPLSSMIYFLMPFFNLPFSFDQP